LLNDEDEGALYGFRFRMGAPETPTETSAEGVTLFTNPNEGAEKMSPETQGSVDALQDELHAGSPGLLERLGADLLGFVLDIQVLVAKGGFNTGLTQERQATRTDICALSASDTPRPLH
jgi:hypothetical protein